MKFKWIIKWKGFEIPTVGIIIFLVAAIWSSGLIIAPLTLPPNSVEDLTPDEEDKKDDRWGVGAVDNGDITKNMNPYAKHYYDAGDFNCHTIKKRSFFINGNQMPFCVRDVAIFFGMVIGLGIALFIIIPLKWWWLIGGLVPIGLDGGLQLVTSYESNNLFRLLTGGLAGLVTAFALGYVVYDASKMGMMKRALPQEPQMEGEKRENLVLEKAPNADMDEQEKLIAPVEVSESQREEVVEKERNS